MATLAALIPAEFFAPPPVKANPAHGRICISTDPRTPGGIQVSWNRGCPIFAENLAAARSLKNAGLGGYNGVCWTFRPTAVLAVLDAFATSFVISDDVKALAAKQALANFAAANDIALGKSRTEALAPAVAPTRVLHGKVTLAAGVYAVSFGNDYKCSREAFAGYLDSARRIKRETNSRGWNGATKSWLFNRSAAGRILAAFPATYFDFPSELAEDAAKSPAPVPVNVARQDARKAQEAGPDALATNLLALADDLFA